MAKKRRVPRYQQEESEGKSQTLPPGRVAADVSQHAPHNSYGPVPLYYEDKEFRCIVCRQVKVWTAEEQKWWYEVAKGPIYSTAVRCSACRKQRDESHAGTPRRSHRERREENDNSEKE